MWALILAARASIAPNYHLLDEATDLVACTPQMDSRKELSRCAKDHLSTYANDALPFAAWLKGVESRIAGMTTLPRTKDLLLLEKDDMKVRRCAYREKGVFEHALVTSACCLLRTPLN